MRRYAPAWQDAAMPKPATAAFNGATACDIGVLATSARASRFQRALHQPLEEELLGEAEGDDARRDHDHVNGGDIGPGPLPLTALGGGEDDRHGASLLVVDERHAQQVFAPRGDEIDDQNDDEAVAHHRQADQPQRPPGAGAIDPRRFDQFVRHELKHAAHDEDADRELEGDIGQDQAGGVVDQPEEMLGLVDADERDDANREIKRYEQRRRDQAGAAGPQMH